MDMLEIINKEVEDDNLTEDLEKLEAQEPDLDLEEDEIG